VAGFTDREDEDPAELPVIEHQRQPMPAARPGHGTPDRLPVCCLALAFALAPLAGDRHQVLLDAGAVVASWPASPIERTKARKNCR
jgi:hypothetical protein